MQVDVGMSLLDGALRLNRFGEVGGIASGEATPIACAALRAEIAGRHFGQWPTCRANEMDAVSTRQTSLYERIAKSNPCAAACFCPSRLIGRNPKPLFNRS